MSKGSAPPPNTASPAGRGSSAQTASPAAIEITGLEKSYKTKRGSIHVIEKLDLTVRDGEFVSLLGPSGCGKSTLLLCIAGLQGRDAGSIKVVGRPIQGPYTECGIVFQAAELLEWRTALRNVLLQIEMRGLRIKDYEAEAKRLLDGVGLSGFEDRYPSELSGGMQQRVALSRALVHDPQILLMDEPFGALDALTRDQMNTDLQRIWLDKRKTVVFVTHSIEEAVFLSDRVVVFSPRPARVALELDIDLPRPRRLGDRTNARAAEYVAEARATFESLGVLHTDD